jgi:hypothetical protein
MTAATGAGLSHVPCTDYRATVSDKTGEENSARSTGRPAASAVSGEEICSACCRMPGMSGSRERRLFQAIPEAALLAEIPSKQTKTSFYSILKYKFVNNLFFYRITELLWVIRIR